MSSSIQEEIDRFVEWANSQYSKRTVDTYKSILLDYLGMYGAVPSDDDLKFSKEAIVDTVMEFLKRYSNDSQSKAVASFAIRAYYSFRGAYDLVIMLPKYRSGRGISVKVFSNYYYLWDAITHLDIVERAVLGTSYVLALRLMEVTLLKNKDLSKDFSSIIVHREKGPAGNTIDYLLPISPCGQVVLSEYIAWRNRNFPNANKAEDPLFINSEGNPVNKKNILRYFHHLRMVMGEGDRFHQLRHTRATELAEKYGDAIAIARFLGHRNINTVLTYIHMAGVRKSAEKGNYWHCYQDIPLREWKWVPV